MRHAELGTTLAVGLLLAGGHARAAQWWVEQAADTGGNGSQERPFRTLNEARDVVQTGDTVWVRDGTYEETVDFWHVPEGSGARTTIAAEPGHAPVIDGGGASGFVIQAGETPNMTFRGLTVRNGDTAFSFYYSDGGEVIDCTTEAVGGAISFYHASQGYVSGSKLEGSVAGKESEGTIIEDNEIFGSRAEGITLHADSRNCRYSRNVVHDNTSVNIYLDSISHTLVESNLVFMSETSSETTVGIMLADESYENVTAPVLTDITIINNVVINNESGIRFWDGHFAGESAMRNVVIANNTVINNRTTAIKWDAGPHDAVVRNNIFAAVAGAELLLLQANSTAGVSLDHNLWYLPDVESPFLWDGTTYDHAGWANATGHGEGDVNAAPDFVGPWTLPVENLQLEAGSPAVDSGTAVPEVTDDFSGGERPSGSSHDLGAFEYGAEPAEGRGPGAAGGPATDRATGGADSSSGSGGRDAHDAKGDDDGERGCGCRVLPRRGGRRAAPAWVAFALGLLCLRRRRTTQSRPDSRSHLSR